MKKVIFLSAMLFLMGFSSICRISQGKPVASPGQDSLNPMIVTVIQTIHPDSIRTIIQHLQDDESRFKLLDNRREIATWLAEKFLSFGLTDVHIDSFFCHVTRPVDTTLWQYNVTARIMGQSAPCEEDLIGAHYDSYNNQNPFGRAPGADDNGSGVAAVLEIARVMMQQGYRPESTITFALFAAEELGGHGSEHMASAARETGRDIRYMLNLDMIANNPDSLPEILIYKFYKVEAAGRFAGDIFNRYTGFPVIYPTDSTNNETDSYFFWLNGFPTTFFIESDFSPNWHTENDTVGACNLSYCAEVTRGACATLMEDQLLPYPRSFSVRSSKENITLTWLPTKNAHVAGYTLYRSANPETGFTRLNQAMITDSFYVDHTVEKGEEYFYFVRALNHSLQESHSSEVARGVRIEFSDTLLIINSVANGTSTPDEIVQYYSYLLDTIPFIWYDVNKQHPLSLHLLDTHRNIWWMSNDFNYTPLLHPSAAEFSDFFGNGGNMLLTAFTPSSLMDGIEENVVRLGEESILRSFFKADSVVRKPTSLFYRALPDIPGYDTLTVDPEKGFIPGLQGELQNIETYATGPEGTIIYLYDSHYDSSSSHGASKGKPVGLENIGTIYRTILLSFPLFFIDTSDAKAFIQDVLINKFPPPTGIEDPPVKKAISGFSIFPNPAAGSVTVLVTLEEAAEVTIFLYTSSGVKVGENNLGRRDRGNHCEPMSTGGVPSGLYYLTLKTADQMLTRKLILVR
ncbi:MAG: M20/M25/M40 family metallo-hydrolase [Bacteroidales bacterium]|nr:M20/M25/M40 family metallo-hydrolase [Bacteroidales bacterium]